MSGYCRPVFAVMQLRDYSCLTSVPVTTQYLSSLRSDDGQPNRAIRLWSGDWCSSLEWHSLSLIKSPSTRTFCFSRPGIASSQMSQQLLSWTRSTPACASKLALTTSYTTGNGSKTAVSWRPGKGGSCCCAAQNQRSKVTMCRSVFFAENTVSTYKYIWPQRAGHVKHPIIKVKWILMAVIQCKRKPWSWLPSWHKTNLDGIIERNVHWSWGIKCCHSNPVFVGGHVETNLLPACRLWVMALPCWEWGSNTGVNWATPGGDQEGHLCHLQNVNHICRRWFPWLFNEITFSCVPRHGGQCQGNAAEAELGGWCNIAWRMEGTEGRGKE